MAISIEQAFKVLDLLAQLMTYIGIGNTHTMSRHLYYLCSRLDVVTFLYGVQSGCEWLVLYKHKSTAVIDKGVAGNTSLLMISLRETAVYNHKLAIGLDRILAIAYVHRHMAVDDVTVGARNLEGIHNVVYNLLVVEQHEVISYLLVLRILVGYKVAFECSHLRLVEQGTVWSAPQVEEVVGSILAFFLGRVGLERCAYKHTYIV